LNGEQNWNPWKRKRIGEQFHDRLNPILVAQDEVREIFDEMMCLGSKKRDLVDNEIPKKFHNEV
jgi:hypothetical protein